MKRPAADFDDRKGKRRRTSPAAPTRNLRLLDLSEETLLQALSELDYADLLTASETSSHLYRLANDDQLWKLLYNRHFLGGRKRRPAFKASERPIKPLHNGKTWKELFRVAYNWSTGNARTTQLSLRSAILPPAPSSMAVEGDITTDDELVNSRKDARDVESQAGVADSKADPARPGQTNSARIAWYGRYYFAAARQDHQATPCISIYTSDSTAVLIRIYSKSLLGATSSENIAVSELCLDDKAYCEEGGLRLAVFYTNGQYSIFRLRNLHRTASESISWVEEYFSSQRSSRPTVAAKLHSPLLVTSSRECAVRFRLLEERKDGSGKQTLHVSLSQPTMRSHMCFAPMAMRLEPLTPATHGKAVQDFRVSLAYSTPYYPADFTVGIQVFDIHLPNTEVQGSQASKLRIFARNAVAVPPAVMPVIPSRPSRSEDDDDAEAVPHSRPQAIVTSIQHDGPYVVTSKSDNTISVYKISDFSLSSGQYEDSDRTGTDEAVSPAKMHARPLRIKHLRTLFGHTAGVDAINVADGRCVSTGRDGLKVWELPQSEPDYLEDDILQSSSLDMVEEESSWLPNVSVIDRENSVDYEGSARCSWLGLDSSKIVAICDGQGGDVASVKVYDFE